jgi:hypothetical protein
VGQPYLAPPLARPLDASPPARSDGAMGHQRTPEFSPRRLLGFAALLLVLLGGSGTAQDGGTAPIAPDRPNLETRLLAAIAQQDDLALRIDALHFLAAHGGAGHVEAIGKLLDDPVERIRSEAIFALHSIGAGRPEARRAIAPLLFEAMNDPARRVRHDAIWACNAAETDDWGPLERVLSGNDFVARSRAALVLAAHGVPLHPRDVAEMLHAGNGDRRCKYLLPQLNDPAQRDLLTPYLESADRSIAQRAREVAERLDAIAAGKLDWEHPIEARRRTSRAAKDVARRRIGRATWEEVDPETVLAAVADASTRVVLFAEMHHTGGPLRAAQRLCLERFARAAPTTTALGFEPSVEEVQQPVIDRARELGLEVFSTEPDGLDLLDRGLSIERDVQTVAVVNEFLARSPEHRVFVTRGENHCMPGDVLASGLTSRPTIILTVTDPPLAALGENPSVLGRAWRIGAPEDRLFYWGVGDPVPTERLAAWRAD